MQRKLSPLEALPLQTFFIPLPEASMFDDMFYQINSNKAEGHVESLIAVAISIDNTVIWYDHWEDGYETYAPAATAASTEVWGDGNQANGCAPNVDPCTDENDKLNAGTSVVIQNTVELPRDASNIRYDGGDRMQASFPIAVTRGAYPEFPGSLMAGAVEVLDTESWGTSFEAPVGENILGSFKGFQYTALFFMAAFDGTTVTLPNASNVTLDRGQGSMVRVNQGDKLTSDKIILVDLITGDVDSQYELRWYSLLDIDEWSREYVSPVGDSVGKTKMVLYNPGSFPLEISVEYLTNDGQDLTSEVRTVEPGRHILSLTIPSNSGALVKSSDTFLALSLTDTEYDTSLGQPTGGQWYDWGFPVLPRHQLTPQVLIGWGYGCTDNRCYGHEDRSVVWVTPVADADIYVDYNNTGTDYAVFSHKKALSSTRFTDSFDTDMSGAVLFATEQDSGPSGPPVDIAAAWGQDPEISREFQQISLDLGTVVLPFASVRVNKVVDKETVSPGEILTYTIRISNVGQTTIQGGSLTIVDQLDSHVTYVEDSATFEYSVDIDFERGFVGAASAAAMTIAATNFPLDEGGYVVPHDLPRRGGVLDITFQVVVDSRDSIDGAEVIINNGIMNQPSGAGIPFEAISTVVYGPNIQISNAVYLVGEDGASCDTAVEFVAADNGEGVVYCFTVTNTGFTHLNNIVLNDEELSFTQSSFGVLAPGESASVTHSSTISENLTNTAVVSANPVFPDGSDMPDQDDVSDSDPSAVSILVDDDDDTDDDDNEKDGTKPFNCLQHSYVDDAVNDDDLICTTKEVFLESISTAEPISCTLGEMVNVTLSASIHLESSRYDLGWYVAADDGDALEGFCVVNGLQEGYEYNVVEGPGSTTEAGFVSWDADSAAGGSDSCGDVFLDGQQGGGNIDGVPFVVNKALRCSDENEDGNMDLTVCFTWRLEDTDDFCTLADSNPLTQNKLADLYPGNNSMCYCASYDIPTITVVTPPIVPPCSAY